MNKPTIKLIAAPDNPRALLFKHLISMRSTYVLMDDISTLPNPEANYNIFFDFSGYEDRKDQLVLDLNELNKNSITIFDITINDFLSKDVSAYIMILAVSARFVTCANALLQEIIYENTGRLAAIVDDPIIESDFEKPDGKTKTDSPSTLRVVWYGDGQERFSIKPYLDHYPNLKAIVTKEVTQKQFDKEVIEKADIVFLPKTFTVEDEQERFAKVEWCIRKGKFVAAPGLENDYEGLAFDYDLDQALCVYMETEDISGWIKESQEILKRKYNPEISADQFVFALKEAPKDDFLTNLDYLLEQEEL